MADDLRQVPQRRRLLSTASDSGGAPADPISRAFTRVPFRGRQGRATCSSCHAVMTSIRDRYALQGQSLERAGHCANAHKGNRSRVRRERPRRSRQNGARDAPVCIDCHGGAPESRTKKRRLSLKRRECLVADLRPLPRAILALALRYDLPVDRSHLRRQLSRARVKEGKVPRPIALPATECTPSSFTIRASTVNAAHLRRLRPMPQGRSRRQVRHRPIHVQTSTGAPVPSSSGSLTY